MNQVNPKTRNRILGGVFAGIIALACTTYTDVGACSVDKAASAIANSIIWGAVIVGLLR